MTKKRTSARFIAGLSLVAPFLLGAKGCDAVVGSDPRPCGGLSGARCDHDQFCDFAAAALCGAADATGLCRPIPETCTEQFAPVCGCDDRTYGNACLANLGGISVASEGECDSGGGEACGGLTGADCDAGEFCNFSPNALCGAADATGTCTPIPAECSGPFDPVCGCDGRTYSEACSANMGGISVASEGECEGGGGQVCGGLLGMQCPTGAFCNFPADAACGFADATGTCEARPVACEEIFTPVCGCDGLTYSNACEANRAGVTAESDGPCDSGGGATCGGLTGASCTSDQFCNFPPDTMCGFADGTGTCEPRPEVCDDVVSPVCGCDGTTYTNECRAHSAGFSVTHEGACG